MSIPDYLERVHLTEKGTRAVFMFLENEFAEIGPFQVDESMKQFMGEDLGVDPWGYWRVALKSGRVFDAEGTTKDYDRVLKCIIRNMRKR